MSVFFSWVDADDNVHNVILDASPKREMVATAQVTEHPVETGAPATDYIRPMPLRLTVEGFVTNTPIGAPPEGGNSGATALTETRSVVVYPNAARGPRALTWQGLGFSSQFDRVREVSVDLVDAILHGYLFAISTSLREYENMAATQMTVTETPDFAGALQFSIEFQELRIVSTQIVAVPVRKQVDKVGSKTPTTADGEQGKVLQSTISAIVSGPDAP